MDNEPRFHGVDDELRNPERVAANAARWADFRNTELLTLMDALGDRPSGDQYAYQLYQEVEVELRRRKVVR